MDFPHQHFSFDLDLSSYPIYSLALRLSFFSASTIPRRRMVSTMVVVLPAGAVPADVSANSLPLRPSSGGHSGNAIRRPAANLEAEPVFAQG